MFSGVAQEEEEEFFTNFSFYTQCTILNFFWLMSAFYCKYDWLLAWVKLFYTCSIVIGQLKHPKLLVRTQIDY